MKNWFVKLPNGGFTLESDTPGADLVAKGYAEFALTEIPPRTSKGPLPDPMFQIPQWALDAAIEGLQELALRREIEAADLAKLDSAEGRILAQKRLEQAWEAQKAHEFFLHL